MNLNIFGAKGISLMKLYHVMCRWMGGVNPCIKFGAPPPQNLGKQKTSKIRRDLGQLSTLTVNISGTDKDIDKRSTALSTTVSPTLNKKSGKLWTINHKVVFAHFDLPNINSSRVVGQLRNLITYCENN